MLLYHVNLGYPLLDEGSEFRAPVERVMWRSHEAYRNGVGYRTMPAPQSMGFTEQVYTHAVAVEADGTVPAALINRRLDLGGDGPGLAFLIEYRREELPVLLEWQSVREGGYALGIEPSTAHPGGAALNEEHGLLRHLDHGESRRYRTRFSVVAGGFANRGARGAHRRGAPAVGGRVSGRGRHRLNRAPAASNSSRTFATSVAIPTPRITWPSAWSYPDSVGTSGLSPPVPRWAIAGELAKGRWVGRGAFVEGTRTC